jgi:hypothetical protein
LVSHVASTISADGGTYPAISVSLQDVFGNPAVAPSNIVVQLASSRPDIMTISSPVIIATGQTYVFATVKTALSPGSTNITASASGYGATSTLLTSVVPAPDKLALYVGPNSTVMSPTSPDAVLTVQLQDINGLPARAQQATSVTITASNATIIPKPIVLNIPAGSDFASVFLSTENSGLTSLTASSPGLGSSSLSLNVVASPVTESLTAVNPLIYTNETATLLVGLHALGQGVKGAQVQWFTDFGQLSSPNSTTDASGATSVTLASAQQGIAHITALITSPFTGTKNLTATVIVLSVPVQPTKSFYQEIQPYLIYIVIIIIVVVAVLVYFFLLRPWRRRRATAEGPTEEEQPFDELEEVPGGGGPGGEPSGEGGETGEPPAQALGPRSLNDVLLGPLFVTRVGKRL